jgi:hypothetical protein
LLFSFDDFAFPYPSPFVVIFDLLGDEHGLRRRLGESLRERGSEVLTMVKLALELVSALLVVLVLF